MGFVDFHCHVLPAIDDGARNDEQSRSAMRAFAAAGAAAVVATPHFDASLVDQPERFAGRMARIDEAFARLQAWSRIHVPALALHRGVELKLDVPEPCADDARLRLAGGPFVLVEFPGLTVPVQSVRPLTHLRAMGYCPILAHPERYGGFDSGLRQARVWRDAGALLQVNAGSILGAYGPLARRNAVALLAEGLVDYVCSDYHGRREIATVELLEGAAPGEKSVYEQLVSVNPQRMLEGEAAMPVMPMQERNWWERVARSFSRGERQQ